MADLVVKSKVKEYVQSMNLRCSSEAVERLNSVVEKVLKDAAERCKGNKRSTIKEYDL